MPTARRTLPAILAAAALAAAGCGEAEQADGGLDGTSDPGIEATGEEGIDGAVDQGAQDADEPAEGDPDLSEEQAIDEGQEAQEGLEIE